MINALCAKAARPAHAGRKFIFDVKLHGAHVSTRAERTRSAACALYVSRTYDTRHSDPEPSL